MTQSAARESFLSSLCSLEDAIELDSVRGGTPAAALLRKGLAVTSFNILEGFIVNRWREFADYLNRSTLSFEDLPASMKQDILRKTLTNAASKLRWSALAGDALDEFVEPLANQFSLGASRSVLSEYSLSGGSNVSGEDVKSSLAMLGANDPWGQMTELVEKLGIGSSDTNGNTVNLSMVYKDLSETRNGAAHDPDSTISYVFLRSLVPKVRQIALGYDIIGSAAATHLSTRDHSELARENLKKEKFVLNLFTIRCREKDWAAFRGPSGFRVR